MASILNASLSSGLVATGDTSGIIQLQSNGTQTVNVATNGIITNTFNSAAGLVEGYQYYALNSGYAGANSSTAQPLFGASPTLAASTQYEFEIFTYLAKSAGTTSHDLSALFAGSCTVNFVNSLWYYWIPAVAGGSKPITTFNSVTSIDTGLTSATQTINFIIKGIISVNTSGTLIPQYKLSTAPGGAYTTQAGSYFKIAPLGASGSNISIGSWA